MYIVVSVLEGIILNQKRKRKSDVRNTTYLTTYKYYKLICSLLYANKKLVHSQKKKKKVMKIYLFRCWCNNYHIGCYVNLKKKNGNKFNSYFSFYFFLRRWAPNSLIELGHGHYTSNQ